MALRFGGGDDYDDDGVGNGFHDEHDNNDDDDGDDDSHQPVSQTASQPKASAKKLAYRRGNGCVEH